MPASEPAMHEWVYVLVVAIPTIGTLLGVWLQSRKTRRIAEDQAKATRARGTDEHLMARKMLEEHGVKLDRIDSKVDRIDAKVDRMDGRVVILEDGARAERRVILSAVEDHGEGA